MIGVIDYQAGNTRSVLNALMRIGIKSCLTSQTEDLDRCDGVILPGVGSAGSAMRILNDRGLSEWIRRSEKPFLGICLGMQLLFEFSDEGSEKGGTKTLGLVSGHVRSIDDLYAAGDRSVQGLRVPHMGWDQVKWVRPSPLQTDIPDESYMYYAHSFAASSGEAAIGATDGLCAAVQKDNFFGVQFHPEKSGPAGLRILKNFEALCR